MFVNTITEHHQSLYSQNNLLKKSQKTNTRRRI